MRRDFKEDTWEVFNKEIEGKKLIIFGVSDASIKMIQDCKRYQSRWNPAYFIDNNTEKQGALIEGLEVKPPAALQKEEEKENIAVLITGQHIGEMSDQLEELGISQYYSAFWMDTPNRDFYQQMEMDEDALTKIKSFLQDDVSKDILDKVIEKRKTGFMDYSDVYSPTEYFIDSIFKKSEDEVFIDGGGYDGDTIEEFGRWTQGKFVRIYSFEPDKCKAEMIRQKIRLYGGEDRVKFYEAGLADKKSKAVFKESHDFYSSHLVNDEKEGSYVIQCLAIDEVVKEPVTFIKLDIEGAELKALEGAKNTILKNKPKLAICIYHKLNDLWEIPLWIYNLVPEYKFYIRHHGMRCYGTIIYATIE